MTNVPDTVFASLMVELDELESNPEAHSAQDIADWKRKACEFLSPAYAARLSQVQFYEPIDLDFDDLPF